MQTFLPYDDFEKCATVLDTKRLGKQRLEAAQILRVLDYTLDSKVAWRHHPAVMMWGGNEWLLQRYYNTILTEWISRGYRNNMPLYVLDVGGTKPFWFGDERLHSSHRAALLAKNYEHYKQFGWTEEPKIDYFWPVKYKSEGIWTQ